ncbi:uncharacterized protein LOC128683065 isoform X2 [Plodia interpunctella]|uniref:uncharacterized protein LOC128683065 isoform X2 n=1 Tax=Plodia interpunctella TaxID=58824 RepID=UPI002367D0A3|nr:uncharacterized protein LOC128683065 isoform X2 [Plodia interpunctella]
MDRFRQKVKKDKPKYTDKEKPPLFITDVKTIRENLKIKEILRTVKMNSSMRVKAPRGSKVMQNKDFNDNDEFDDSSGEPHQSDSASATNSVLAENSDIVEVKNDDCVSKNKNVTTDNNNSVLMDCAVMTTASGIIQEENMPSTNGDNEKSASISSIPEIKTTLIDDPPRIISRDRKLSLDQAMWSRRQSLSQSEIDLHSIGKSPLERKSSFFRKKMDSFFKNTTEIFKKHSVSRSKSELVRRGSMSQSLQSLNEKTILDNDNITECINQGSTISLQSSTAGQSTSSLVTSQASLVASQEERLSPVPGDQESQTTEEMLSGSANSLNDAYLAQGLLSSRAISMSSGLDTAVKRRKRKTSLANRVTWLASETMTNYLKRVIPDDKEMPTCHSYQDLSSIPENKYGSKTDSKGRRLSYQRAVSGEDPVPPTRYSDSSFRRRHGIPENPESDSELTNILAEYSDKGVPTLKWFQLADIVHDAMTWIQVAEKPENLEDIYELKKLPPNDEARQAVVRELVVTEAQYIRHLMAIVEVFIAAAHALQDAGKLLDIDTGQLFSNIPDVLNASLYFWEATIYPMLIDATKKKMPFNTEQMSQGFCRFRELFNPYEKYVIEQTKVLDYLRSLSNNTEFMIYLTWCHAHKTCKRLQLSDILVKPMQRLTKYSLILRRIIAHTDYEPERTSLMAMESFAKNYVLDINRSIRQKEELEKLDALANSIDPYEIEFKDDEIDKYFRMYAQLHLKAPMLYCVPTHSRSLIFQGDLRFKDNINPKEIEVHVVLLTDMILICKKQSKGLPLRLIRPKYMIDKIFHFPRWHRNLKDVVAIVFIVVDDVGSATFGFCVTESTSSKPVDPNIPPAPLRLWEQKVREARLSYDLGVWFARNPSRDLSEVEVDSSAEYAVSAGSGPKPTSDDINIEREARERVAAMLHRSMGASTDYDLSQASLTTDSFDCASGPKTSGAHSLRHPMQRNSTGGSSRNSRLSSFQQSTSAASHDEPGQPGAVRAPANYKAPSTEQVVPQITQEEVVNITVNVVSESESETIVPAQQPASSSPSKLTPRLSPHGCPHGSTHGSAHGSPHGSGLNPASASEKLYQSHQELLHRNRLSAQHHQFLTPDHRGTSYPPPSPTRGSLKRGLAFSYSFKNPPLSKMGHVNSQTQAEAGPSSNQQSPARSPSPMASTSPVAGPSTEKTDKIEKSEKSDKKKHFSSSSFFSSGGWHSKLEG